MSAMEESLITAYALNELDGPELVQVERLLQSNPAGRAEVKAIQDFCGAIEAVLAGEPIPGTEDEIPQLPRRPRIRWMLPLAAAVVFGLGLSYFSGRKAIAVLHPPAAGLPTKGAVPLGQPAKSHLRNQATNGTLGELKGRSDQPLFTSIPTSNPKIPIPEATLANSGRLGFGLSTIRTLNEFTIGMVDPRLAFVHAVPQASVLLSVHSNGVSAALASPAFAGAIVPGLLLQDLNSPPPSTDLRVNFSFRSPAPQHFTSGVSLATPPPQIIPLPGYAGGAASDRAHPAVNSLKSDRPVYYFTPDPQFVRSDVGIQIPLAKLQVIAPREDLDRGGVILAIPAPRPAPPPPPQQK